MARASVLAVGLDPQYADFSQFPELTPDLISAYLRQQTDRIRKLGFVVDDCFISPDAAGERALAKALQFKAYDCVVIGAGLREPPDLLLLFEQAVNLVRLYAPQASICFNSSPADTAEAVLRWA